MTETATQTQTLSERAAVYPTDSDPTTEDVVIQSENFIATPETKESRYDEQVKSHFTQSYNEYTVWLDRKVKNELLDQIFSPHPGSEGAINLASVWNVIHDVATEELNNNFQTATYLENEVVPVAETRTDTVFGDASYYIKSDVEALWVRIDAHLAMVEALSATQPVGEAAQLEVAETMIRRLLSEARDEAIVILKEQKLQLEAKKREADKKIAGLERTIESLTVDLETANDAVLDRDLQLLDSELVMHLTNEARELAA